MFWLSKINLPMFFTTIVLSYRFHVFLAHCVLCPLHFSHVVGILCTVLLCILHCHVEYVVQFINIIVWYFKKEHGVSTIAVWLFSTRNDSHKAKDSVILTLRYMHNYSLLALKDVRLSNYILPFIIPTPSQEAGHTFLMRRVY